MKSLRPFVLAAAFAFGALPLGAQGVSGPYLSGKVAEQERDFAQAAASFAEALIMDPENLSIMQGLIGANIALGEIAIVQDIAQQMVDAGIGSKIAQLAVMANVAQGGAWGELSDMVANGGGADPLVDGLAGAWAEVGMGDMTSALHAFDEISNLEGFRGFGLYNKALALALVGDLEGAEAIFSGAAAGPVPTTRRGAMAHAEILSQLERDSDAVAVIDATFGSDLDPALAEMRAELVAGAKLPFTHVRDAKDGLAEVFYEVAGALEGEATDDYTLLYARVAQFLRPDHIDALLLSAELLERMGRYDLATEAYRAVPSDDPSFHAAELGRADALRRAGKTDAAIEVLERLSETHGTLPIVHLTLGDFYRGEARYGDAVHAYDTALALYDSPQGARWFAYYTRGIAHERLGDWDKAEADFRMALELNPGQPQVLNYLGYSLVEMDIKLPEALSMIEQAVAASPDSGHIVDSLGWVFYRLGRYEEAVVQMERAAELMPVDPVVTDHLGDSYWAVGRQLEARFQWHRALSFGPEEAEAARIRSKLDIGLDRVLAEEGAAPLTVAHGD